MAANFEEKKSVVQGSSAPECPICSQEFKADDKISVTPGGHSYHEQCITTWLRKSHTDPQTSAPCEVGQLCRNIDLEKFLETIAQGHIDQQQKMESAARELSKKDERQWQRQLEAEVQALRQQVAAAKSSRMAAAVTQPNAGLAAASSAEQVTSQRSAIKPVSALKFQVLLEHPQQDELFFGDVSSRQRLTAQQTLQLANKYEAIRHQALQDSNVWKKLPKQELLALANQYLDVAKILVAAAMRLDGGVYGISILDLKEIILSYNFSSTWRSASNGEDYSAIAIRLLDHVGSLTPAEYQYLLEKSNVAACLLSNTKLDKLVALNEASASRDFISLAVMYVSRLVCDGEVMQLIREPRIRETLNSDCILALLRKHEAIADDILTLCMRQISLRDRVQLLISLQPRQKDMVIASFTPENLANLSYEDFSVVFVQLSPAEQMRHIEKIKDDAKFTATQILQLCLSMADKSIFVSYYINYYISYYNSYLQGGNCRASDLIKFLSDNAAKLGFLSDAQICTTLEFLHNNYEHKKIAFWDFYTFIINSANQCFANVFVVHPEWHNMLEERAESCIRVLRDKLVDHVQAAASEVAAVTALPAINPIQNYGAYGEVDVTLKALLLGDCGVGKSCLLLRYADDTYTESHISTIGVNFKIKTIGEINGETVKLQIWDVAGQERFDSNSQYYRGANIVILAFDITDRVTFDNIKAWFLKADRYVPKNAKYILVGCKSDLTSKRVVTATEAGEFAAGLGMPYYETSARNAHGVEAPFEIAARQYMQDRTQQAKVAAMLKDARSDIKKIRALPDSLGKVKLLLEYRINRIRENDHQVESVRMTDGQRKIAKLQPLLNEVNGIMMDNKEHNTESLSRLSVSFAATVRSENDASVACLSKHREWGGWLANGLLSPVRAVLPAEMAKKVTIDPGAMENCLECARIVETLLQQARNAQIPAVGRAPAPAPRFG